MCLAQTAPTQQELETRLKSQFLMLRGMWEGEKLTFDSQGNLIGSAQKTLFSLSAAVVTQIQLSDTQLEIQGRRAGLQFSYNSGFFAKSLKIGARAFVNETLDVAIARDPLHPEALDDAISKVFSVGIDERLAAGAPSYWQSLLEQYLHPNQPIPPPSFPGRLYHPGGGVTNPVLFHTPDPGLGKAARQVNFSGVSVVGLIVDTQGVPQQIRIVRPLGLGLDEFAVYTVGQYRFKPAIYRGQPVPVEVNVEVNFNPD